MTREIRKNGECVIRLSARDKKEMSKLVKSKLTSPYRDIEPFFTEAEIHYHNFPIHIRKKILEFRKKGNQDGVLMVKGLPVGIVPPTPNERRMNFRKNFTSELWLCSFASALGEIFNFIQEGKGRIIENYYPTDKDKLRLSGYGSGIELEFHTETHFHPYSPDYIILLCLRQDPLKQAKTNFTSVRNIVDKLTVEEKDILFGKNFLTGIYYSYGELNGTKGFLKEPISVLYGNPEDPFMRIDRDIVVGKTLKANEVLEKFKNLIFAQQKFVRLEKGDMLMIDNKRVVHGRSSFTSFFNGKDRWIQRALVIQDIRRAAADIPGKDRIIRINFTPLLEKGKPLKDGRIPYHRLIREWIEEGKPKYRF